jgi:alpha-beta hydrolase superfamily lysophospholipase
MNKKEEGTDMDDARSVSFMQKNCPAIMVSFVRLLFALALAPISMLTSSCLLSISVTKRYMEVSGRPLSLLLQEEPSTRGRKQGKAIGTPRRRNRSRSRSKLRAKENMMMTRLRTATKWPFLSLTLLPIVSALGVFLGFALGFVFIVLWAFYGEGSPEQPFSPLPLWRTERRSIPIEAEEFANEVRKRYTRALAFDTIAITKQQHTNIHCHLVKPKRRKAKGMVIIQHGLHSHGGASRVLQVAAHFAMQHDYVVFCPDAPGHGRSSGGFGVVLSFQELAENFAYVADACHDLYPDLDIFVKGASLGGLTVLWSGSFMRKETFRKLRGIISVCPALMVHEAAGSKALVEIVKCLPADILKQMFPKLPTTTGPKGVSFSEDPELGRLAQEESDADPLEYKSRVKFATALTFMETLINEAQREKMVKRLQRSAAKTPVLIQHGTLDRCVDVNASRQFIAGLKNKSPKNKKKLIEYEGKCHVLLSEDKETASKYLQDMSDFVNQCLM